MAKKLEITFSTFDQFSLARVILNLLFPIYVFQNILS